MLLLVKLFNYKWRVLVVELIKIGKVNGLENFYDYSHLGQMIIYCSLFPK